MKNICVLVSGGGTNLQALMDAQREGLLPSGRISCVVSSRPDAYALERARQAGIPALCVRRKEFEDAGSFSRALHSALEHRDIDLIVQAGFLPRLDADFCKHWENRIMNVHPSLLPAFGGKGHYGLHVHEAALNCGVKVTGATVHFVSAELDQGPIILQKAIPVLEEDTPESLQKRVMEACEWVLLPQAVSLFCEDLLQVQDGRVRILTKNIT